MSNQLQPLKDIAEISEPVLTRIKRMPNYRIDGHNLSDLFDTHTPPISFSEDPRTHIPKTGSIIYSVWDHDERFIYIGISGLQKPLEKRDPLSRMVAHASGNRSGDQFCVYIHDFFVIPELIRTGIYTPSRGELDKLTKYYIHNNLYYRFVSFQSDDSDSVVRRLENKIKRGEVGVMPLLNGNLQW